jgi:hypothetical protein
VTVRANLKYFFIFLIYPLIWIFQGIDFTDFGFWASSAELLFTYPQDLGDVAYLNYFSNFIAWLSTNILPFNTIFDMRLAWAFLMAGHALLLYHFFHKVYQHKMIFWLILISEILYIRLINPWIGYNYLSAFYNSILMILGYQLLSDKNNRKNLFFIGFIAAMSFFSRFPNILNFALVFYILIQNPKSFFKNLIWVKIGYLSFIFLIFILVISTNQFSPLLESWEYLVDTFINPDSRYGSSSIVSRFKANVLQSSIMAFFTLIWISLFIFLKNKINKSWVTILLFIVFYFSYKDQALNWVLKLGGRIEPTMSLIVASLYIYLKEKDKNLRYLLIFSSIALVIGPLGSDNGMRISYFHTLTITSIILIQFYLKNYFNLSHKLYLSICLLLLILNVNNLWHFHYRDAGPRHLKTYSPGSSFQGVFTSKERSLEIEKLMKVILEMIPPNKLILDVNNVPMVYLLTKGKPYLRSTWSSIIPFKKLQSNLRFKMQNNEFPDFIIRPIYSPKEHDWPKVKKKLPLNGKKDRESVAFLNKWIKEQQYRYMWKGQFFEILTK